MKKVSIKIDVSGLTLNEEDSRLSVQGLWVAVVTNVIMAYSQQHKGLPETDRRKFYKIIDVCEVAVKDNLDVVELEDDWEGFLRKCFRECLLMPTSLLRKVEETVLTKD